MEQSYTLEKIEYFLEARQQYESILGMLCSEKFIGEEHGVIEGWLRTEGNELCRRLLQGHLDRLAAEESVKDVVIDAKGLEHREHRFNTSRQLMTVFGEVTVRRIKYSKPGKRSLFPLDAVLNLPEDKYSHGLQKIVAEEASKGSFDSCVEVVRRDTGGVVPKLQAEQLVTKIAKDFAGYYSTRRVTAKPEKNSLLALTTDGKGVVMRPEGLRQATRNAQLKSENKLKTRLSKGEKANRKRMATVASVYYVARHFRSAEQIMGESEENAAAKPRPTDKRVWASIERDADVVVGDLFDEALRRDPELKMTWVLLVDGQQQQLNNIRARIREHNLAGHVTLILDFIHVLEYLWSAAYCFHPEGSQKAEDWVRERALRILNGKSSHVAAGIRSSASKMKLKLADRAAADKCSDYLLKYSSMLRYDKYLKEGFPIATGVIEGACRHLVKDRMDITGARWGLTGAEAVLKLRSLSSSGDMDQYWQYHTKQELLRNHKVRYMDFSVATAA